MSRKSPHRWREHQRGESPLTQVCVRGGCRWRRIVLGRGKPRSCVYYIDGLWYPGVGVPPCRSVGPPPSDTARPCDRVECQALVKTLREALDGVKRGDCFCEAGLDNPMMGGRHTDACAKATAALVAAEGA